jgi:hypothetical protein
MIGSCHTVPVKLEAGARRDGRDPQAMISMDVLPFRVCCRAKCYTSAAHAKSPASPPGFLVDEVLQRLLTKLRPPADCRPPACRAR